LPSPGSDAVAGAVVSDLWRFPVKSLGGERLRRVFVGPFGLLGDRRWAAVGVDAPVTARRAHGLLAYAARYADPEAADGAVVTTPDGRDVPPTDAGLGRDLSELAGEPVTVVPRTYGFFDVAPVHLLGEASLAALGRAAGRDLDRRRFRANVLVDAGAEPFAEDRWVGRRVGLGGAVLEVVVGTERCAVTTFDPDTRERHTDVLAALARERENLFGVYARVVRPGWVAVGDALIPD
jgi:hypothetical protein